MSSSNVYKKIDIVGSSPDSIEDAIRNGLAKASETIRNLQWFEVDEIRGWISDGAPQHYQVAMKVGVRIE